MGTPFQSAERLDLEYPNPVYAWYVVVLLTAAYIVSFIDRQVMNLMVEPIKASLNISDTQMSLLLGLAFGLFYTVMGIPLGRLADSGNRSVIIIWGVALWSAMTAACGLARGYIQLFLARTGVGVGEAALSPAALSIISDLFPKERRTLPLGFYNLGIYVGSGLAMVVGGAVIDFIQAAPHVELPVVGRLLPWQVVFVLVGLPGFVIALLMFTVKEPVRRDLMVAGVGTGSKSTGIPFRLVLRYLLERWRVYGLMFLAMGAMSFVHYSNYAWVPTMFIRKFGWSIREVGVAYGLVVLVAGPLGIYFGGLVGNRLIRKGKEDGLMRGAVIGSAILIPGTTLVSLMPNAPLAIGWLFFASLAPAFITANVVPALLLITPNQIRGQAYAIFLFSMSVVGLTLGPTAVAVVTDYVFKNEAMLPWSLSLVTGIASIACLYVFHVGLGPYQRGMAGMKETRDEAFPGNPESEGRSAVAP